MKEFSNYQFAKNSKIAKRNFKKAFQRIIHGLACPRYRLHFPPRRAGVAKKADPKKGKSTV